MDKTNEITKQVKEAQEVIQRWWSDPLIIQLLIGAAVFIVIRLLVFLANRYIGRRIKDNQIRYRVHKVNSVIGYVVILFFLGIVFKDRLAGLSLALGVIGAGVAFALQEVIASFAGYVAINFAGFFTVGHRIQLGGIKGDVIDIGLLRTTLMEIREWVNSDLYTGRIVRIANSFVFKEPVFNYSGDFPFLWDEITIPLKFGCDYRLAKEVFEKATREIVGDYTEFAKKSWTGIVKLYYVETAMIDPMVTLVFNDNWIEFTIRYIVDYKVRRLVKHRLYWRILEEIDNSGGRIKIASTTLQLVDTQPIEVHVREADGKKN
jgi:small-conductance mechanosensitive channel